MLSVIVLRSVCVLSATEDRAIYIYIIYYSVCIHVTYSTGVMWRTFQIKPVIIIHYAGSVFIVNRQGHNGVIVEESTIVNQQTPLVHIASAAATLWQVVDISIDT